METIIQQIVNELVKKVLKKFESTNMDLNELCGQLLEECKRAAQEMVEACAGELNAEMRADKEGRRGRLVLKEKDRPRTVLTEIGEVGIHRDCYYDKGEGRYVMPLDGILGIKKYERVTDAVGARLVEAATEHSYAKSAQIVTEGAVSRQTVRNRILRLEVPENEPGEFHKEARELHVFADEDHVHLQKPGKEKGKKSQTVPLVTVTEGIDTESRRHRTRAPMSFVNEAFDTKELWKAVSGYIGKAYDVDGLEKIYLHADGGTWIRSGLEEYAQTVHVMDGFHFERDLKRISAYFQGRNIRQRMHGAIEKEDRKKADRILQEMLDMAENGETEEKVRGFGKYLFSHWEEITTRRNADVPGSCTEGQVSHLLSERFSRDPMGWSRAGLGKLSAARIYIRNGGKLGYRDFAEKADGPGRYREYAERMLAEMMEGVPDWSIFTKEEPQIFDMSSGTQQALHQISRCRNILS